MHPTTKDCQYWTLFPRLLTSLTSTFQRLKQWYNNHSRTGGSADGLKAKLLDLQGKKSKKLQPTQVYSRLYYETKLKPIIAECWQTHLIANPEDASKSGPPLQFRNKIIRDLYDSETPEIKAEVERRREEGQSEDELEHDGDGVDEEESQRRAKAFAYQK
jgi:hypothetical protein